MKFAIVGAVILAACVAPVAHADALISGYFGGIVDDGSNTDSGPVNTPYAVGSKINGAFVFDATTDNFVSFNIGGYTAAPAYTSIYSPPLAATGYAFFGVQNQVPNSAPTNSLQLNLYYETVPGPSTVNIASFIANPGPFSENTLDGSASYFAAYITNPNGSVSEVDGLLTSYAAPEPASLALLLPALAGIGLIRRRA